MTPAVDTLDRVAVTGISGIGYHGVFANEKHDGQHFTADVVMHVDTRRAAATDGLADTVDYGQIALAVHDVLTGASRDLVETVAADIARVVLQDERVAAVDVTLHKPQAPVTVPFTDVTVTIRRTRSDVVVATVPDRAEPVVIALGSNLGDRAGMLAGAVDALGRIPGLALTAVSRIVETDPVGGPDQPSYYNAVVIGRTTLSPLDLLHGCQTVEAQHLRRRLVRWGPRTLDVDLITYGELIVDNAVLTLPHPRVADRAFVLVPWLAADPEATLVDAVGPRRVRDIVDGLRSADGSLVGIHERLDLRLGM